MWVGRWGISHFIHTHQKEETFGGGEGCNVRLFPSPATFATCNFNCVPVLDDSRFGYWGLSAARDSAWKKCMCRLPCVVFAFAHCFPKTIKDESTESPKNHVVSCRPSGIAPSSNCFWSRVIEHRNAAAVAHGEQRREKEEAKRCMLRALRKILFGREIFSHTGPNKRLYVKY